MGSGERLARCAVEGMSLLRAFPGLLGENHRLRARAEVDEQECERLRQEVTEAAETLRRLVHEGLLPLSETLQRLRVPRRSLPEP